MKNTLFLFTLLLALSCKNENQMVLQKPTIEDFGSITEIYKADQDNFSFKIIRKSQDSLFMLNLNNENVYGLVREPSASGEKYLVENGKILWLKGQDFMWGTEEQTEYQGAIHKPEAMALLNNKSQSVYGTYVDDSYQKRQEGYDWVSVTVTPFNEQNALISVRSRIDKKKPTCTFDVLAQIQDDQTMSCNVGGAYIVFTFKDNQMSINGNSESDDNKLYFYCSGGGTLKGTYQKLNEPIDGTQVDKTDYMQFYSYPNDLAVSITAKDGNLQISPMGLKLKDQEVNLPYKGDVYYSETDDLDANGSPEVYIYVQEIKNGIPYRSVIAYAFNSKSSMTPINIAPIQDNPELSKGYNGDDEFAVVEGNLVRRFPNTEGGTKQIQYKLSQGEAMWQLTPDKVITY